MTEHEKEVAERIAAVPGNGPLLSASQDFMQATIASRYSYNFFWLGRPIIQYPQDIVMVQELIWQVRPDVVIETGIAHGGSLILSASVLALLDLADATVAGEVLDPAKPKRRVVGVDIDIRRHNREAIEAHPMANRIEMVQGSSIDPSIVATVKKHIGENQRVMVFLDSNHTHAHVLAELEAYAGLASVGSYCVVFDTVVERLADADFSDRPWGPGDNPMSAVDAWLPDHPEFEIDQEIDSKLLVSVAPRGFLKRVR